LRKGSHQNPTPRQAGSTVKILEAMIFPAC
jgi:hypothetical protein